MILENLIQLECNIDDSTPEILSYTSGKLLDMGALDVWSTPVVMKKGRAAILLSVLARPEQAEQLSEILFRETSTSGIRQTACQRRALPRKVISVVTAYGKVDVKIICLNDEVVSISPEFESCRKAAEKINISLQTVYKAATEAAEKVQNGCPQDTHY